MAVPNDRRIVYGTYVVPQIAFNTTSTEVVREEGSAAGRASYVDWKLDTTVAKRFGGKSSGDHVQITHDQASDLWTSMVSILQEWETFDEAWNLTPAVWGEDSGEVAVSDSLSVIRSGATAVKFLYIKNLGTTNDCELALEGDERDILIPPGASVSMRTTSSVTCETVKVATAASSSTTTTIEYLIAI
jgi:hypothetical protein|tara:strand:+ start:42 stop:605 length:564 start_codon:yes stop_codon:yes gene_type:complete